MFPPLALSLPLPLCCLLPLLSPFLPSLPSTALHCLGAFLLLPSPIWSQSCKVGSLVLLVCLKHQLKMGDLPLVTVELEVQREKRKCTIISFFSLFPAPAPLPQFPSPGPAIGQDECSCQHHDAALVTMTNTFHMVGHRAVRKREVMMQYLIAVLGRGNQKGKKQYLDGGMELASKLLREAFLTIVTERAE